MTCPYSENRKGLDQSPPIQERGLYAQSKYDINTGTVKCPVSMVREGEEETSREEIVFELREIFPGIPLHTEIPLAMFIRNGHITPTHLKTILETVGEDLRGRDISLKAIEDCISNRCNTKTSFFTHKAVGIISNKLHPNYLFDLEEIDPCFKQLIGLNLDDYLEYERILRGSDVQVIQDTLYPVLDVRVDFYHKLRYAVLSFAHSIHLRQLKYPRQSILTNQYLTDSLSDFATSFINEYKENIEKALNYKIQLKKDNLPLLYQLKTEVRQGIEFLKERVPGLYRADKVLGGINSHMNEPFDNNGHVYNPATNRLNIGSQYETSLFRFNRNGVILHFQFYKYTSCPFFNYHSQVLDEEA